MCRPICRNEGCTHLAKPSKKYKSGYSPWCSSCEKKRYGDWESRKSNPKYKAARYKSLDNRVRNRLLASLLSLNCDRCGFLPQDLCQMDVHHIDCNHKNNDLSNLQWLCSNCHRLVHRGIAIDAPPARKIISQIKPDAIDCDLNFLIDN